MNTDELDRALKRMAGSPRASAERSRELAASLGDAAADRGELDVAFWAEPSPIGELLIAVTRRGVVRIAFVEEDRDEVLRELADDVSPRILESARATDPARRELEEYFAGERRRFDVRVDRRLIRGIALDVLAATSRVPFGGVTTYGEVADRIGRPRAARAVGNALGSNPIPIVIPCHRVLRAGGALGGYGGGVARKAALLTLEGALPSA